MPTHYEILGVDERAPPDVIRGAYLEHMRRVHPDRNRHGPADVDVAPADLTAAYTTLKDPFKRASYDFHLARTRYPSTALARLEPPRRRFRVPPLAVYLLSLVGFALLIGDAIEQTDEAAAAEDVELLADGTATGSSGTVAEVIGGQP